MAATSTVTPSLCCLFVRVTSQLEVNPSDEPNTTWPTTFFRSTHCHVASSLTCRPHTTARYQCLSPFPMTPTHRRLLHWNFLPLCLKLFCGFSCPLPISWFHYCIYYCFPDILRKINQDNKLRTVLRPLLLSCGSKPRVILMFWLTIKPIGSKSTPLYAAFSGSLLLLIFRHNTRLLQLVMMCEPRPRKLAPIMSIVSTVYLM